jgi:hypothetical protein
MTPEEIDQLSAENLNYAVKERIFGFRPPGHPEQVAYLARHGLTRKRSMRWLWLVNGEPRSTADYTWLGSAWDLLGTMLRHPDPRRAAHFARLIEAARLHTLPAGEASLAICRAALRAQLLAMPPPPKKVCAVAGCGRKHLAKGFCGMHYQRLWAHGDPLNSLIDRGGERGCSTKGCTFQHYGKGLCRRCYWRAYRRARGLRQKAAATSQAG